MMSGKEKKWAKKGFLICTLYCYFVNDVGKGKIHALCKSFCVLGNSLLQKKHAATVFHCCFGFGSLKLNF